VDPQQTRPARPSEDIVVFIIRRDSKCAECGEELLKGRWIRVEMNRALCLACADLAHLEYLPSGNTALTRRATKHSPLRAVVVQWARARNRYERQGILVTAEAMRKAEEECLADSDLREARRFREGERRAAREPAYVAALTEAIRQQFPGCPAEEAARIADWTCEKHSGRVGRSAAAKDLNAQALRLAVIAHIRHQHTGYDALLMQTGDRAYARAQVRPAIERVLERWEQTAG
jgi:hypothetical protein